MHRKPAASYIKRCVELESLQVRISHELKQKAELAADKLGTSLNRLAEAAIDWYIEQLKKEGSL